MKIIKFYIIIFLNQLINLIASKLLILIFDVGDSNYDSAVVIDNIKIY